MNKTSKLDMLTVFSLSYKIKELKTLATQLIEMGDDSQYQCGVDILDIIEPHRNMFKDKEE
tara:strand:- start:1374 stop:1556 length:183 start_codon:yes stop_codon:yes gene_type:complete